MNDQYRMCFRFVVDTRDPDIFLTIMSYTNILKKKLSLGQK